MYKNVILFGAGASYGSDFSNTPPLGSGLFHELSRFNPTGWGSLPSDLVDVFDDFEKGMTRVSEVNIHWMPVLQRAMAAYFFNFVPSPSNLYRQFAARIKKVAWDGACATLNYERLLELSLSSIGIRPVVGCEPKENCELELVLPHGCCHIFSSVGRGNSTAVRFAGPNVKLALGKPEIICDPVTFRNRIEGDAFPPAMCYFEPTKRTSTGWELIEAQQQRLADIIEGATSVAVIGIRIRLCDKHIWGPLERTVAEVLYCAGKDAAIEYEKWAVDARRTKKNVIFHGYFREEFDRILAFVGLR